MCGIFGVVSPQVRQPGEFYHFLSNLFVESQRRGTDASGFAALVNNEFVTDKRDVSARDFTKLSRVWRSIKQGGSLSLIGHTRAATSGSPSYNANNHPFHGPRYSMAHNGGVGMHRMIAKDFGYELKSSCDSELILHFLESKGTMRDGILHTLNWLDYIAMMAVCTLDRDTGIVHLFSERSGPISIMRFPKWNAVVFASSSRIIHDAAQDVMGSSSEVSMNSDLVFGTLAPDYNHIQILPNGEIRDENLVKSLDIKDMYAYAHHYGGSSWDFRDSFNSGTSIFERNSKNSSKKTIAGEDELENSSAYFFCVECGRDIDDKSYRGRLHSVGNNYMCDACYLSWGDSDDDKDSAISKSIGDELMGKVKEIACSIQPNTRDCAETIEEYIQQMTPLFPLELRIGIGEDTDSWPVIVNALETERAPAIDHDLAHMEMQSYFSYEAMNIHEKIEYWGNMTLARVREMGDGEYLVYYNVISDALNAC